MRATTQSANAQNTVRNVKQHNAPTNATLQLYRLQSSREQHNQEGRSLSTTQQQFRNNHSSAHYRHRPVFNNLQQCLSSAMSEHYTSGMPKPHEILRNQQDVFITQQQKYIFIVSARNAKRNSAQQRNAPNQATVKPHTPRVKWMYLKHLSTTRRYPPMPQHCISTTTHQNSQTGHQNGESTPPILQQKRCLKMYYHNTHLMCVNFQPKKHHDIINTIVHK